MTADDFGGHLKVHGRVSEKLGNAGQSVALLARSDHRQIVRAFAGEGISIGLPEKDAAGAITFLACINRRVCLFAFLFFVIRG
jgi:hypothetical protein